MADTAMTENNSAAADRHPLPDTVAIDPAHPPKHTPREMQMVESFLAKNAEEMTIGEGEQAVAWFALRRLGYDPSWEEASDVFVDQVPLDPTNASPGIVPSSISPGSASSGG